MASSSPPNGESTYDGWFRAFDASGKGFYIDGAFPIRDYIVDTIRWGLPRRSSRIHRHPSNLPTTSPLFSPQNAPNLDSPGPSSSPPSSSQAKAAPTQPYPEPQPALPKPTGPGFHISPDALNILATPQNPTPPEYTCLNCGVPPNNRKCTINCYLTFRTLFFDPTRDKLEIRQTIAGPSGATTGLGVFVRQGQTITKHAWLGEFLGELLPASAPEADTSEYAFTLPGSADDDAVKEVVIDGATHGNVFRFLNSACEPNVDVTPEQVGKVRIIAFRALRDIQGGEQLLINYGRQYFEERGILCCCGAQKMPHLPPADEDG